MGLYEFLLKKYGYNEPIFTSDIQFEDYSRPWIFKELSRLCKNGQIVRYDKGVCYIPKTTFLGKTLLDPRKVILKKYISDGNDTIGYYSGNTLLNLMNLSTQMPNSIEIYTNNEKTKLREISVNSQKVILRRSRTKITKENSDVMQLLELMNFTSADPEHDYGIQPVFPGQGYAKPYCERGDIQCCMKIVIFLRIFFSEFLRNTA